MTEENSIWVIVEDAPEELETGGKGDGAKNPSTPEPEVELKSAKGADYTKLRDLLKAQKWREADQETTRVMLQVANREKEGWLDVDSINNFPCEDLRTIDQLWVGYSKGRFGFSVQKKIWEECGGKVDYRTESKLGDRVGWRKNGEWMNYRHLNFSFESPYGHLLQRVFMRVVCGEEVNQLIKGDILIIDDKHIARVKDILRQVQQRFNR